MTVKLHEPGFESLADRRSRAASARAIRNNAARKADRALRVPCSLKWRPAAEAKAEHHAATPAARHRAGRCHAQAGRGRLSGCPHRQRQRAPQRSAQRAAPTSFDDMDDEVPF